jgi:ABC-type amino acid transport substrate-binding protein
LHSGHPGEGFEVDLLREVAARSNFEIRYVSALWQNLTQRLLNGELDAICTAATITDERKMQFDFSEPYLQYELAVVTRRDNPLLQSVADLAGKTVGVRTATTAEEYVRRHVAEKAKVIRTYHFNTDAYSALRASELDAVVDDDPIARGFAGLLPDVRVAARIMGTTSQYGIMFPKGRDELRTTVDVALRSLREDGTYHALHRKWFGETVRSNEIPRRGTP